MNINLHIERLVLEGVDVTPNQRYLLQASVASELTKMLNSGGLANNFVEGTALPKLFTNSIQSTDNPTQLGQQIAQSVYGGIGHE